MPRGGQPDNGVSQSESQKLHLMREAPRSSLVPVYQAGVDVTLPEPEMAPESSLAAFPVK